MPGRNLRKAVETVQATDRIAHAEVRQGLVVDESAWAIKTRNYDLVCMESSFDGAALRQLYSPNVVARHKLSNFARFGG